MIKKRLFTPGPVSLYPPALNAALEANIHHRTSEFKAILSDVVFSLKRILGDPDHVYLFASSGTGAMESAVTNFFSPGDDVLVASCGKFGERWIELTAQFGLKASILQVPYGEAVNPDVLEKEMKAHPNLKGVFLQACESSTAVQNDIQRIAPIVQKTEAILIVDAVSALATMPLSVRSGIDVLLSGSQKALMIPPGLAFVGISGKAWSRVENSTMPRYYFDLRAARKAWDKEGQTAFTPATSLVISLRESLKAIESWGLDHLIALTENRARAMRAGFAALSLEMFAKDSPANALTAVVAPSGLAEKITGQMKQKYGMHLAGGQGDMKGKILRVSHMGFIDHFDLLGVLAGLEFTLKSLGHSVKLGASLEAFQKIAVEVM
jgi:aspartate aminotransferase-like enzyme